MPAITKKDIVQTLRDYSRSQGLGVKQIHIDTLLGVAIDYIADMLAAGNTIQIRDAFSLSTKVMPARTITSGLTGQPVHMPERRKLTIRPLGAWQVKIDNPPNIPKDILDESRRIHDILCVWPTVPSLASMSTKSFPSLSQTDVASFLESL